MKVLKKLFGGIDMNWIKVIKRFGIKMFCILFDKSAVGISYSRCN